MCNWHATGGGKKLPLSETLPARIFKDFARARCQILQQAAIKNVRHFSDPQWDLTGCGYSYQSVASQMIENKRVPKTSQVTHGRFATFSYDNPGQNVRFFSSKDVRLNPVPQYEAAYFGERRRQQLWERLHVRKHVRLPENGTFQQCCKRDIPCSGPSICFPLHSFCTKRS